MTEELAKYGWMVRVFARVAGEPREQWFMAGFPDEASAVAAVKDHPKALAEATVTAHRVLEDREIKDFGLRPGEAKQYA
ncbi:hypothetical protein J4G43_047160 [Bradyrhizobium barranii subsp. barranii]|uniref:Uncharacterized protein n=1 Tax=Bradyrhizobium barranii subsp. barranii TaxID=2823807 RepID=A0A939S616_9BRAD|nr:hypothetical protein [Bradyrhizobium barranii]UEM11947.1 hypothetical protein J4G43_047160 [Bradyrhizobium barranii subsp. barranii]